MVITRRRIQGELVALPDQPKQLKQGQQQLSFIEAAEDIKVYEYSVLVTNLPNELLTISQWYRDRADCENVFDEMKNLGNCSLHYSTSSIHGVEWGWGGYATQDIKSCRLITRMIALIYNWWNLFVRLARSDKHLEAVTS